MNGASSVPPTTVDDGNDRVLVFPTSFAQQRLWLIDRMAPGSAVYNVAVHRRFRGPLNTDALEQSLQDLVTRHEILRTTFSLVDDKPVQVISLAVDVRLPVVDISVLPKAQRLQYARERANDETALPFDLARGPLFRAQLLRLGAHDHVLLLVVHHIILDGWSVGVLFREMSVLYNAYVAGREPKLPELPAQYADYAVWQRDWFQGKALDDQLSFWRRQLDGVPTLELPADHPRPPVQTFHGAAHSFRIPPDSAKRLQALAAREGATSFMLLLSLFKALLHRYTGQSDLAVGIPVAGRTQRELEGQLGFFVNTLVMRTDLGVDPTFREALRRVRETALDAYTHEEFPFEKLVEELCPVRDMSRAPLFQVMFTLQNSSAHQERFDALTCRRFHVRRDTSKFDLTLFMSEGNGGFRGRFVYNTDLFDADTIERMVRYFCTLAESAAEDPDLPIAQFPLLSRDERDQILIAWNATETDYPGDRCVHELFEDQADLTPDAIALVHEPPLSSTPSIPRGIQLTYRELNARANRLAHRLQNLGVRPGDVVGICMDRCVDLVVGTIGIVKSGAVYLPLDPSHPSERLAMMMEDAAVGVLITNARSREQCDQRSGIKILDLDAERSHLETTPSNNLGVHVDAGDPVYIMYTSGSTGTPKGVVVPHRAVVRLVKETDYVRLTPADVIPHLSNPSFDAATFEIWGALLNGARILILDSEVVLSPQQFEDTIRRHRVTTMFLTTALFNLLAREAPGAFGRVSTLLFGGEICDPKWVRSVLKSGPPNRLINVYGPTETTTFATWHEIRDVPENAASIPIGRPIANTRVYVLDAHQNPVPPGIAGELYIGGPGVAVGYLNRQELTAERFIDDPFSDDPGARLYRTGDTVRWRSDGELEFIGRSDGQVKIRGFRIELGEIEAALLQHPAVQACAAAVCELQPGDKQIAAYVVSGPGLSLDALREYLRTRLLEHAIPSYLIRLDNLPLSPNGKIDRRALPAPERNDLSCGAFVAPRTAMEARLGRLWERVLNHHPIGALDSFFDLGGHSLLAVQLIAAVEREFKRKLPLSVLFTTPTIAAMARVLSEDASNVSWRSLAPVQPAGTAPPLFCVHGVAGHVFKYERLVRYLDPNQPVYVLQGPGFDGAAVPFQDLEEMAREYIREIQTVRPNGPYLLASNCAGGFIVLEMARQLTNSGEVVSLLAFFDPPGPNPGALLRDGIRTLREKRIRHYFAARFMLAFGYPTPHHFRDAYIATAIKRLLAAYRPRPYSGTITLLRARRRNAGPLDRGWSGFALGGVHVYEIDGPHDLMQEPYVRVLASRLQACISEAAGGTSNPTFPSLTPERHGAASSTTAA